MISRLRNHFRGTHAPEARARVLSPWLLLGDAAAAVWVLYAFHAFQGRTLPGGWQIGIGGLAAAGIAWLVGLHEAPASAGLTRFLIKFGALAALLAGMILGVRLAFDWQISTAEATWLALAATFTFLFLRIAYFATRFKYPNQPAEMARWVIIGGSSTFLFLPYYHNGQVGAGDAQWYTVMLADFVTQLRAGVFPVWVGQSVYAFNGAISPLRFAPWFQYAGGLVDVASWHALDFAGLKNAVLALNGLAVGFSAYVCLRDVLARSPSLACILSLLFASSPGVLAPLVAGDQYMSFMATPFIPIVLNGIWRLAVGSDFSGPFRLAVGLAGVWLCHAPIALWCTLLAVGTGAVVMISRRRWIEDLRRAGLAIALFLLLGSLPFASSLSLDNLSHDSAKGAVVVEQVATYFPANFRPIDINGPSLTMYQVGYAALALFLVALLLLAFRPPRTTWLLIVATIAITPIVLPLPLLNRWFWQSVPTWFVTINNVWPMQRLFALWAGLMVFCFAVAVSVERISGRKQLVRGCLALCAALGIWSGREAEKLRHLARLTTGSPSEERRMLDSSNVVLSRYAYAPFARPPAYLSHGYMDPLLENRVLNRDTLAVMMSNSERAAPRLGGGAGAGTIPRLVQTGTLTARRSAIGDAFTLSPELELQPQQAHALRLEVFDPASIGVLQLTGRGLFRQYLLPDSGQGLVLDSPPRSFGILETSSKVLPLAVARNESVPAVLHFVTQTYSTSTRFSFGQFWLYQFEPHDLAIKIDSWIPYRARAEVAVAAYLETPRMWQSRYRATVNGLAVATARSPNNLVMIPIVRGANTVELAYAAPWWLETAFWVSVLGWAAIIALAARRQWVQAWRASMEPAAG